MTKPLRTKQPISRSRTRRPAALTAAICLFGLRCLFADDYLGNQLIALKDFASFEKSTTNSGTECTLTSPPIRAGFAWTELIPSWNLSTNVSALKIEVRGIYEDSATPFYTLGLWSATDLHPKMSLAGQENEWGAVRTDTLVLKRPCTTAQLRLTFPAAADAAGLRFLTLCVTDTSRHSSPLPPSRNAWGKLISVPERSQMSYPNGEELCSPTTVSMLLSFYAEHLNRPELNKSVLEIQTAVYDKTWGGTGNWCFNMAYAGSLNGMRACVSRFSDLSEVEDWIAYGMPVGLSVCYNKLRGKEGAPSGHLVVCVGFTDQGDPIINDPGTSRHVRKTFKRENLLRAWEHSHNTVYLVYPDGSSLPRDRFGHWLTGAKL